MLFQKNQKKISSILRNIYKSLLNEKDIDHLKDQIIQIIKKFNQKNSKKKLTISEKTSLVICYGDNINSNQKNAINVVLEKSKTIAEVANLLFTMISQGLIIFPRLV